MRKMTLLLLAIFSFGVLSAAEPEKAERKDVFDSRIEAWAYGTVWGLNADQGILTLNGQLSKEAIEFAKRVEGTLKDQAGHDPAKFAELQTKMGKMDKRQMHFNYDKAAPVALLQCPVKVPAGTSKESAKVLLTDLKIGDVVLVGFNAATDANKVYSVVLVENGSATNPQAAETTTQK